MFFIFYTQIKIDDLITSSIAWTTILSAVFKKNENLFTIFYVFLQTSPFPTFTSFFAGKTLNMLILLLAVIVHKFDYIVPFVSGS